MNTQEKTPIKRLISELGGTQAKAAKRLKVSQAFISMLENEVCKPSPEFAIAAHKETNGVVTKEQLRPDIFA